jgi:EAL domain-containing protein (putative c-di-GMP-specific phosphodiesterase class I)/PAS domain-containing protein
MGSIEVRNPLLSKKLKRTETRLLIIDDNQIRYNQIRDLLTSSDHQVHATLLDDLQNFEKQLHLPWDVVIFGRAYDLKYEQALTLIRNSNQVNLPLILLKPDEYQSTQYASFIRKGVYDILDLEEADNFYLGLLRALSLSRLLQSQQQLMNELETAQSQAQALVEESNKAIALIQEGIHVSANAEYLQLFGLSSEDDIIGQPLLDILQPKDVNDFKIRFKKISQGQFDLGAFEVATLNNNAQTKNPLKVEFLAAPEDDALQLTIEAESERSAAPSVNTENHAIQPNTYQQINRAMTKQPSDQNALVSFALSSCPDEIFKANWATTRDYFNNIYSFLNEQTHIPLFKAGGQTIVGLFQAESQAKLESKLIALNALTKPQLITVENNSYPVNLRIGYTLLKGEISNLDQFENLLCSAFKTALPTNQDDCEIEQKASIDMPVIELINPTVSDTLDTQKTANEPTVLKALHLALERGEIHLKYQQLYDKEDTNLYTYEVTSGFIYGNTWKDISSLKELSEDHELSIKLDRWILVESCKQLHNFITQYPEAKLIVNLNKAVLLNDRSFPEFIAKLITIVRSKLSHPIILQFSEDDISQNIAEAQKYIAQLRQYGAEVSIRDFGNSIYSESILRQLDINNLTLHENLTRMLSSDANTEELQEKVAVYHQLKNIQIMLRDLNDMTSFANAWNVDARFIQGDYFQKKLDHLIDVQDQ